MPKAERSEPGVEERRDMESDGWEQPPPDARDEPTDYGAALRFIRRNGRPDGCGGFRLDKTLEFNALVLANIKPGYRTLIWKTEGGHVSHTIRYSPKPDTAAHAAKLCWEAAEHGTDAIRFTPDSIAHLQRAVWLAKTQLGSDNSERGVQIGGESWPGLLERAAEAIRDFTAHVRAAHPADAAGNVNLARGARGTRKRYDDMVALCGAAALIGADPADVIRAVIPADDEPQFPIAQSAPPELVELLRQALRIVTDEMIAQGVIPTSAMDQLDRIADRLSAKVEPTRPEQATAAPWAGGDATAAVCGAEGESRRADAPGGAVVNPNDYLPASKIVSDLAPPDFTMKNLRAVLDKHSEIRRYKPSQQRLNVHIGDWLRYRQENLPTDADPTPDRISELTAGIRARRSRK
ncbi:MAG: hypothetical protein HY763_05085 [Planctomycetes bacterium]|nr:hypothetical protein [Planctomycetota bacterium]